MSKDLRVPYQLEILQEILCIIKYNTAFMVCDYIINTDE